MKCVARLICIISWYINCAFVASSPVTFELRTGQQECMYVEASSGTVISYYFAVQHSLGSKMELDYEIFGPDSDVEPMFKRQRELQGEWSFLAHKQGEYAFCFQAPEADLVVDVQIVVDLQKPGEAAERKTVPSSESFDPLQDNLDRSLELIERQLAVFEANMRRYKARTNRNGFTVLSFGSRARFLAVCGTTLTVVVLVAQTHCLKSRIKRLLRRRRGTWSDDGANVGERI
ncbi:LAME_0G19548g1_1 [Lachancea meyersii CBS 8951]|uniref:LAME_0G19548g1_1 n=1 Tax=Lachancea meyersii CBS 8951 TaxID=1266667 RepID=A0A1G4KCH1_9SACH|nr:LAME_0G19548g1_1 [Lachancea meyersii CBS 8951]